MSSRTAESDRTSGFDKAIQDKTEAIQVNPKDAKAYYNRGTISMQNGDFDNALKDFDESILLDPTFPDAYCNRASIRNNKGDLDNALKDYNEAIQLDPKHVNSYANRGTVWQLKGDLDNALKDVSEAIRLNPIYSRHYLRRANVWLARGELENAVKDYKQVIHLDQTSFVAHAQVAWLRATSTKQSFRNGKEAIEFATRACELSEWKQFNCLATLAAAYAEAGDFMSAVKWQEKVVEIVPEKERPSENERLDLYRANKPFRDTRKK